MKKNIAITAVILALTSGCGSEQIKTFDALEQKVSGTAAELSSGKNLRKLETRNRSNSGYYYILNNNGTIIYHPEKGLTGSDFSRFGFVRKILKEQNGCIRSEAGTVSRIIIFREKGGDEILCYTIPDNEITGSERCARYIEEEAK